MKRTRADRFFHRLWPSCILVFMIMMMIGCLELNPYLKQYFGKPTTGTYLKLIVRDARSNRLVSGVLVQVVGKSNDIFRQGKTGSNGTVTLTNLEPGTYVVRAWKGTRVVKDTIYIKGPVSALMRI